MFDKLKGAVGEGALKSAIETYGPRIGAKIAEITQLKAADVKDDARFTSYVVKPALATVIASSGGATKLISNFDQRFTVALLHLRDQLVVIDEANDSVGLVPDYQARVVDVLKEGFQKK
jgi:aspartate 1-decarboxylase